MAKARWVKQPSIELCANQCGAQCCRSRGDGPFSLRIKPDEKGLFPNARIEAEQSVVDYRYDPPVLMRMSGTFVTYPDRCEHLNDDNLCDIYEQRPVTCRKYPSAPVAGCYVWPKGVTYGR